MQNLHKTTLSALRVDTSCKKKRMLNAYQLNFFQMQNKCLG